MFGLLFEIYPGPKGMTMDGFAVLTVCDHKLFFRGSMKYYTKQYKSAIDDLTTAVTLDRQCSLAYFNRALCQQVLRNTDKVVIYYCINFLNHPMNINSAVQTLEYYMPYLKYT